MTEEVWLTDRVTETEAEAVDDEEGADVVLSEEEGDSDAESPSGDLLTDKFLENETVGTPVKDFEVVVDREELANVDALPLVDPDGVLVAVATCELDGEDEPLREYSNIDAELVLLADGDETIVPEDTFVSEARTEFEIDGALLGVDVEVALLPSRDKEFE